MAENRHLPSLPDTLSPHSAHGSPVPTSCFFRLRGIAETIFPESPKRQMKQKKPTAIRTATKGLHSNVHVCNVLRRDWTGGHVGELRVKLHPEPKPQVRGPPIALQHSDPSMVPGIRRQFVYYVLGSYAHALLHRCPDSLYSCPNRHLGDLGVARLGAPDGKVPISASSTFPQQLYFIELSARFDSLPWSPYASQSDSLSEKPLRDDESESASPASAGEER